MSNETTQDARIVDINMQGCKQTECKGGGDICTLIQMIGGHGRVRTVTNNDEQGH